MYDLNNLIDPALKITLSAALDINDNGQIVAYGGGNSRTYLLTPVPEPSTLTLFGTTLLALAVGVRRPTVGVSTKRSTYREPRPHNKGCQS